MLTTKRLTEIKNRLAKARAAHPRGTLPSAGDLQALQDCVDEIARLNSIITSYNCHRKMQEGGECYCFD